MRHLEGTSIMDLLKIQTSSIKQLRKVNEKQFKKILKLKDKNKSLKEYIIELCDTNCPLEYKQLIKQTVLDE
tara:strand:- start:10778 stop:10993 length:216 start_codon:yes stop_codon:yes gene_type:complete